MEKRDWKLVSRARAAALQVLLHNVHGPYRGLPRTAGWGYPEPYTRDMMISSLGILVSGNGRLMKSLQRVLDTAAANQSRLGHIPSLVHDKEDRGASDCTPLFLMAAGMFRIATERPDFLEEAVAKAMTWVEHQSPSDRVLVAQLPTSDWRDEQWVLGYGLFVNTVVYTYLCLFGHDERARSGTTVFVQSVIAHAGEPLALIPITRAGFPGTPEGSNAFTLRRFLVPWSQQFRGWALFADGADMLCRVDLNAILAERDEYKAVQVVKHDYQTKHPRKYVGAAMESDNPDYWRKNWASVMLITGSMVPKGSITWKACSGRLDGSKQKQ